MLSGVKDHTPDQADTSRDANRNRALSLPDVLGRPAPSASVKVDCILLGNPHEKAPSR
jgi:hypothetical protein